LFIYHVKTRANPLHLISMAFYLGEISHIMYQKILWHIPEK